LILLTVGWFCDDGRRAHFVWRHGSRGGANVRRGFKKTPHANSTRACVYNTHVFVLWLSGEARMVDVSTCSNVCKHQTKMQGRRTKTKRCQVPKEERCADWDDLKL
jgi:hypothetical protein